MTEALTGYELASVEQIDAAIDGLGDAPSAADCYVVSLPYSERALGAVAAKRAGSGGGGGGGTVLASAVVSLLAADILVLHSSPKPVVATPGSGKAIIPVQGLFVYRAGDTGYTTSGHLMLTTPALIAANPDFTPSVMEINLFTAALGTDDLISTFGNQASSDISELAALVGIDKLEDQPIVLYANGGDPTTGNGTATVQMWYLVADV